MAQNPYTELLIFLINALQSANESVTTLDSALSNSSSLPELVKALNQGESSLLPASAVEEFGAPLKSFLANIQDTRVTTFQSQYKVAYQKLGNLFPEYCYVDHRIRDKVFPFLDSLAALPNYSSDQEGFFSALKSTLEFLQFSVSSNFVKITYLSTFDGFQEIKFAISLMNANRTIFYRSVLSTLTMNILPFNMPSSHKGINLPFEKSKVGAPIEALFNLAPKHPNSRNPELPLNDPIFLPIAYEHFSLTLDTLKTSAPGDYNQLFENCKLAPSMINQALIQQLLPSLNELCLAAEQAVPHYRDIYDFVKNFCAKSTNPAFQQYNLDALETAINMLKALPTAETSPSPQDFCKLFLAACDFVGWENPNIATRDSFNNDLENLPSSAIIIDSNRDAKLIVLTENLNCLPGDILILLDEKLHQIRKLHQIIDHTFKSLHDHPIKKMSPRRVVVYGDHFRTAAFMIGYQMRYLGASRKKAIKALKPHFYEIPLSTRLWARFYALYLRVVYGIIAN